MPSVPDKLPKNIFYFVSVKESMDAFGWLLLTDFILHEGDRLNPTSARQVVTEDGWMNITMIKCIHASIYVLECDDIRGSP